MNKLEDLFHGLLLLLHNTPRAAKKGLSVTLMERLVKLYGDQITAMLTTQYRYISNMSTHL